MNPELRAKYEVVIGIECHVQLATRSKLFCWCDNDSRDAEPNTHVCPICFGMPGTLPVLNKRAVELALRMGLALNAEFPDNLHTKFDRKNYFYPDSPKGYQITQFDEPIVPNGVVEFPLNGELKRVGITRAHLEGDAGKLTHPDGKDYSLVDLNRAETPLLEIVSEPDMRSAAEAKGYAQELHNLARYAGVSDANLYYGNMRFDVNVSVMKKGAKDFGTRTETKNLNSFRYVERTVEYETRRQIAAVENGERIRQETRGWNEAKGETYPMRSKEDADEYRYFPEPDLPPLVITRAMVDEQRKELTYLPNDLRKKYREFGLQEQQIEVLVSDDIRSRLYVSALNTSKGQSASDIANWLITDFPLVMADPLFLLDLTFIGREKSLASAIAQVFTLKREGKLSSSNVKALAREAALILSKTKPSERLTVASAPDFVAAIAKSEGLLQQSDTGELGKIVDEVIAANPQAVEDYKSGNHRAFGALVGQAMKATQGKGNPPVINQLLKDRLG